MSETEDKLNDVVIEEDQFYDFWDDTYEVSKDIIIC